MWVRNLGITQINTLIGTLKAAFNVLAGTTISSEAQQGKDVIVSRIHFLVVSDSVSCCPSSRSYPPLLEAILSSLSTGPPNIGSPQ